jgi:crotonobetainyl-CoA:carnitine CoA-transferase CaiB-like acyl-CoA transferase
MLGPAGITTHLADLGAEVIKVEPPAGDYIRQMTWPIVEGVSLMHLHLNRGKKSLVLDLKNAGAVEIYKELVKTADCVVEAMRPGSLARLGLGYDDLKSLNPKVVFCNLSGYGMTGPYQNLPAHGIAFDTWAGVVNPGYDDEGFCYIPEHASIGIHAGPIFGAFGILAAIIRARESGEGSFLELGQSDAAAYMDWYRSESHLAYRRPEDVVTGNAADDFERRAVGTKGMKEGVRYQMYDAKDGSVLIMCSEQVFWKNFCEAVDRLDLFEKWPGSRFADHARNNRELQVILREIFKTKTCKQWLDLGNEKNFPMAPVNTPKNIVDDPQFKARFPLYPHAEHGADMLPFPVRFRDEALVPPSKAPEVGEQSAQVLRDLLGYDDARIEGLKEEGVFG